MKLKQGNKQLNKKTGDMKKKKEMHIGFLAIWHNKTFGENTYDGRTNIDQTEMDQGNLLKNIVEFRNRSRPRTTEGKDKKKTYENDFKSRTFPILLDKTGQIIYPLYGTKDVTQKRKEITIKIKITM